MGMPVGAYSSLVKALPAVEFVDCADILIGLRMVKSSEELAYMRQAAAITGRARQRLFDQVEPGMTERQVARLIRQLILEEGGDRTAYVILQLGIPGSGNPFHYDRPLEKGMVLAVDTGACVGMYTIDYPRMATLGPATSEQRRVYQAALRVDEKMAQALRPGVRCSELHQIGVEAIAETRAELGALDQLPSARMGHGQGPTGDRAAEHMPRGSHGAKRGHGDQHRTGSTMGLSAVSMGKRPRHHRRRPRAAYAGNQRLERTALVTALNSPQAAEL